MFFAAAWLRHVHHEEHDIGNKTVFAMFTVIPFSRNDSNDHGDADDYDDSQHSQHHVNRNGRVQSLQL